MDKKLGIGESLVGQCFLEKDIILLTQVPKDYVKITSGLGLATPACVLLIPIMANDQVTGVIELASFEKYDEGTMEFLRKASEAIATSIISAQTTEHIKTLLNDSQQRAEELRAQEEEMRQNMEELTATQEEMARKSAETENRVKAINESGIASIEFSLDGTILEANQPFLDLMGYTLSEIQGRHHSIFTLPHHASTEEYRKFWEDLSRGIPRPGEFHRVTKSGKKIYIKGAYSIIRDQHNNPVRVMKLATDITSMMTQQEELGENMKSLSVIQDQVQNNRAEMQSTLNAINESLAVIEFNPQGEVLYANTNFLNLMGYKLDEIIGKHHRMFVGQTEQISERYAKFWKDLADGQTLKGEFNRIHKKGEIIRIRGNYSPIKNHNDQVEKIIKIAYEVEEDIIPERLRREMSAF
jgi:methyl-accepting chemotaxis protein